MRNILYFLLGWVIAACVVVPFSAHAAMTLTPMVPGLSGGSFASAAGGFAMTAANDGFVAPAVVNVGGKAVSLPATLRMAANAGKYATEAMRLNPWGIAGTLAAGWLLDKGLSYLNGQWNKALPDFAPNPGKLWSWTSSSAYPCNDGAPCAFSAAQAAAAQYYFISSGQGTDNTNIVFGSCTGTTNATCAFTYSYRGTPGFNGGNISFLPKGVNPNPNTRPATQPDWDVLPDPLPAVAPELPFAPYDQPQGVPVNDPEYAPADVPLGNPYTKPDGSTAQGRAKISDAGNGQVTVAPYEVQVTDAAGQPVANPTPQATPDTPQTDCDKKPNSVGCTDLGTPPAGETMPSSTRAITFAPVSIPGAATCPAPIPVSAFGKSFVIPYDSICTYASGLKPVVIAIAYLSAALIIFGVSRSTQT